MEDKEKLEGLKKLLVEFDPSLVGKLPKPTKAQTDEVKRDFKKGIRCKICGGWHHPKVVHLDYVGHAACTARLLEADPMWSWEPMSLGEDELPRFGKDGGLWIKLTVCGVTRLGYGSADGKSGGNAIKEAIGDAIRNAGMRFGIALNLWSKEDLHNNSVEKEELTPHKPPEPKKTSADIIATDKADTLEQFEAWVVEVTPQVRADLTGVDLDKFKKYLGERRDAFSPKKPQFLICPNNNKEMPVADCAVSDCHETCKNYQDAVK